MHVCPKCVVVSHWIDPRYVLAASYDPWIVSEHYLELNIVLHFILRYKVYGKTLRYVEALNVVIINFVFL